MKPKIHSTENTLSELAFIFCGKTNEFIILEDCQTHIFEDIIDIAMQMDVPVRVVKHNPICQVCKEPLACNRTKSIKLNKTVEDKSQKYIHRKCEKSSYITSLIKFKDKFCTYMRSICDKRIIKSLIGYSSYQNKKKKLFLTKMKYLYLEVQFCIMNKDEMID